jgi:hypothetical protein
MGPERAQSSLLAGRGGLVAHDEQRLAGYVGSEICFWIGNRALHSVDLTASVIESTDELPSTAKNFAFFNFKNFGIGVEAGCERVCALNLFVHIEV